MTITGDWWTQNKRPMLFGVESEVSSESATPSLRFRSIMLELAGATSTEAAGQISPCSTVNLVWSPTVAVNILAVYRYAQTLEEMATCDNFVLYGAGGACAAGIVLKTGTTDPARYTRTAATLYTVAHPAGTNFVLRRFSSTCSVTGRSIFQVDYETSG